VSVNTGLRQAELLALRWMDIDWPVQRIRLRRNYVRGKFGTPKSKRSSRAVPLADRSAGELELLFKTSAYQSDEARVLPPAHRQPARPLPGAQALQEGADAHRGLRGPVPRPEATPSVPGLRPRGCRLRILQEWMGHRDFKTTLIYADCAPSERETEPVEGAFRRCPRRYP
jgi:integrase